MPFKHPLTRDLAWILSAPPLYQQGSFIDGQFLTEFARPLWPQLAQFEQQLTPPFVRQHRRLGSYYEQLWYTLLHWHPDYQLLARDHTIWQDQRTKGALDLVLRHLPSGNIEHWELAIKFYLGDDDGREPSNWLGPGRKDCLANKLEHMLTKQLPLSATTAAKQQLQQQGWRVSKQRILLQGRLYLPTAEFELPPHLATAAPLGRWYGQSSLPPRPWRLLAKGDWLAGRDWRLLPKWGFPKALPWPRHLYDPSRNEHAFVVEDQWQHLPRI
ncbi:DUF1853 family protein [uncultured Ferrimonas sp.]|uniref:DUF1853 family protein n=1 Tax=uncultured Ferrimonas sp. TaxID=432640 RepID=UPI00261F0F4D|nr:DUF1853 family protein [uncultured Ferrimonas sp.]